jgi:DNA-binding transcriptional MerR regulator
VTEVTARLMTVGELARRTGLSVNAIRECEALALIYSARRTGRLSHVTQLARTATERTPTDRTVTT